LIQPKRRFFCRAVIKDQSLSMLARNVKIVSANGNVMWDLRDLTYEPLGYARGNQPLSSATVPNLKKPQLR
jgi:hypothetical protein